MSRSDRSPTTPNAIVWLVLGVILGAALVALWFVDPTQVRLPLCMFHATTGLACPGCGATRATHALLHGRLLEALHDNALFVLVLPLAAYAGVSEWRRMRRGRPLPGDLSQRAWFYLGLAGACLLFAVLRNLPWWPLTLLSP